MKKTFLLLIILGMNFSGLEAQERTQTPSGLADSASQVGRTYLARRDKSYLPGMRDPIGTSTFKHPMPVPMLPGLQTARELLSEVMSTSDSFDPQKSGAEGQTVISYRLAEDADVTFGIYSFEGTKVQEWKFTAGTPGAKEKINFVRWNGTNETGHAVVHGNYVVQIQAETPRDSTTAVVKIKVLS